LESGNEIAISNSFGPLLESLEEDEERDRTQSASHMTDIISILDLNLNLNLRGREVC
jgi:hypothetical protein